MNEYTKHEYCDVILAWKIQNIIMFPGVHGFTKIVNSQLIANLPISHVDIAAAERVFGPNLGALKGKMPKHRSVPVAGTIDSFPLSILNQFQEVVLTIDLMFVNKLPFLITVSCSPHFGTVEFLTNCQVPTVTAALACIVQTYQWHGFCIATALADPESEPLQATFGDISFNFCTQNEHIPEIEWYICMVKDHTQSGYNLIPFECIPCIMLIHLVGNAVFWLNAILPSDGVSESLSPCYLLTGKHLDYQKHVWLEFSAYVQTHGEHTNAMMPWTIGTICLGPLGKEQGGHYIISLMMGCQLLHDQWTELPMLHDANMCASQMGRAQGMSKSLTFAD